MWDCQSVVVPRMRQELLSVTTKIKGVPSTTRNCAELFPNEFEAWLVCCSKGQFSSEVSSGRQRYTLGAVSPTSIVLAHVSHYCAHWIYSDASSSGWQSDCKCIFLRRIDNDWSCVTTVGVFHSAWERRGALAPWCARQDRPRQRHLYSRLHQISRSHVRRTVAGDHFPIDVAIDRLSFSYSFQWNGCCLRWLIE